MCAVLYSLNGFSSLRSLTGDWSSSTILAGIVHDDKAQSTLYTSKDDPWTFIMAERQARKLRGGDATTTDAAATNMGYMNLKVANLIPQIVNPETNKHVRETLLVALAEEIELAKKDIGDNDESGKEGTNTATALTNNAANKTKRISVKPTIVKKTKTNSEQRGKVGGTPAKVAPKVGSITKFIDKRKNDPKLNNSTLDAVESPMATTAKTSTDPLITAAQLPSVNNYQISTPEFVRHPGVVIATKVHGPGYDWDMLEQSLCLLHYAYNHRVLYDIVVFSTLPVPRDHIRSLRNLTAPARVTVVVDNQGIQNEINQLPEDKHVYLLKRCNVTSSKGITWETECEGIESHHQERLAYNWQAEFRSLRVWHHPALASYRYMMWVDADSFCTKPWERDPVAFAIDKEAVILFDHFPQGHSKPWIQNRMFEAFGAKLCKLWLTDEGKLATHTRSDGYCGQMGIPNIHGFFHITDMFFYRSPEVQKAIQTLFGHCFLCRFPDDQLSVTAPAAMLAPNRSLEMRTTMGTHLDVFHNHKLDGIDQCIPAGFKKYWPEVAAKTLPSADGMCPIVAAA